MPNLIETEVNVFIVAWYENNQYCDLIFKNEPEATKFIKSNKNIKMQIHKVKSIKRCE